MANISKGVFKRFFVLIGVFAIVLTLFTAFWVRDHNKLEQAEKNIAKRFKEFKIYEHDFYLPKINVLGPNGDFINLRKNKGKYTILNIWATWCAPCVKELPLLKKLDKAMTYESGWRVIAVSIDTKKNLPKVAKFTKHYGVEDIANYNDYNLELQNNIDVSRLPMTLIINKSGRVLYEIHGYAHWNDKEIIDFFDLVRKVY